MPKGDIDDLINNPAIYMALGIAGLFFGFFFLLIGFITIGTTGIGSMFFICSAVGLIPGFLFIAQVFKLRKKDQELQELGNVLQAYRRITMAEIARKLGVNEFEAEKRVAKAIEKGYVKGYIDRNTHEFFTVESMNQVVHYASCPKCGAPRDKLYLVGEQVNCSACGSVL